VFQVNTYTLNQQGHPSVAVSRWRLRRAWKQLWSRRQQLRHFAQRFAALATLDIDGNLATDALPTVSWSCASCSASPAAPDQRRRQRRLHALQRGRDRPYLTGLALVLDIDSETTTGAYDAFWSCATCWLHQQHFITGTIGSGCAPRRRRDRGLSERARQQLKPAHFHAQMMTREMAERRESAAYGRGPRVAKFPTGHGSNGA
jgi:hypothetical protein